ncbi:Hypothetical_protein [Hexamita inflata]|uniref:Hypothetical_protein n=1 Tax=Hexamita inflata TaxID=28002 RepID=A0ABP1HVF0_9EUKA
MGLCVDRPQNSFKVPQAYCQAVVAVHKSNSGVAHERRVKGNGNGSDLKWSSLRAVLKVWLKASSNRTSLSDKQQSEETRQVLNNFKTLSSFEGERFVNLSI